MTEIKVNLSKAQKLLDRIKKDINSRHPSLSNHVNVRYSHQGAENMEQELQTKISDNKEEISEYINVLKDLSVVREALFMGNIKSGISEILTSIADQKKIKTIWTDLETSSNSQMKTHLSFVSEEALPEFYNNNCTRFLSLAVNNTFDVNREVYTKEELKASILLCSQRLDKLEEKRDNINHTYHIAFQLSETSMKTLGLVDSTTTTQ